MTIENNAATTPPATPAPESSSFTPGRVGSGIQIETISAPSELESVASGSILGTTTPFSRPSTETPIVGTPSPTILSLNGSHINPTSGPLMDAQKFHEPKEQRSATVYALSNADYPPAASASPAASTLGETLAQPIPRTTSRHSLLSSESRDPLHVSGSRSSLSSSKSESPQPLPLTSTASASSAQRPIPVPNESTPLLTNVIINSSHADNKDTVDIPSTELPTHIRAWFLSKLFGLMADFINTFRWRNFTRPFDKNSDSDIVRLIIMVTWAINFIAMIAQGLLGGLRAENFVQAYISVKEVLLSAFGIASYGAMEGKRRLVGMFTQMSAEKLPARIDNFPHNVTKQDVIYSIFTWPIKITISSVFAVLAQVSLSVENGAAGALLKYNLPWTNALASFLTSIPVIVICMWSALMSNLIGFPTKPALINILDALDHLFRTASYKHRQAEVQRYVDALLMYILSYTNSTDARYNSDNSEAYARNIAHVQRLINEINHTQVEIDAQLAAVIGSDEDTSQRIKLRLLDKIVEIVKREHLHVPDQESWATFIWRQTKGLVAYGISVFGLWNFYDIAILFLIPFCGLPTSWGVPAGVLAMIAMSSLCFMAVYKPFSSNDLQLEVLTTKEKTWNYAKALFVCGVGALTNLQQAYMTNTIIDPFMKYASFSAAFLSPVLIETPGYYFYTTMDLVSRRKESNAALGQADNCVNNLTNAKNLIPKLTEENMHTQYIIVKPEAAGETQPKKYISFDFFKSAARRTPAPPPIDLSDFVIISSARK